jgi:hypothetical protein
MLESLNFRVSFRDFRVSFRVQSKIHKVNKVIQGVTNPLTAVAT